MTTTLLTEAAITAIGRGLLNRTLPKPEWTHAAHFAAALYILARPADIDAPREMPAIIRAYNEATGVANTDTSGYHETITLASLRAAHAHLAAAAHAPLQLTLSNLLRSDLGKPDWLLSYWSRATLFSVPARLHWIAPDLADLPYARLP
jgi:hypothetical protein